MKNENYGDSTILTHYKEDRKKYQGAVVPPIFQNSLFTFENWEAIDTAYTDIANSYVYTRGNNPTNVLVEEKIAKLACGEKSKLFASGMGAISAAIMHCIRKDSHVIAVKNTYGPANNFLNIYLKDKFGIETTFVKGEDVNDFREAIKPNTHLIYLESPSTAVFSLQNLTEVAKLAKSHGIKTIIDNTWSTPIFQKPLTMGIDIEVHSCSKYMGGHSDIVAGVLIGSKEDVEQIHVNEAALFGAKMSPFESWLLLRGLRTLPIRMKQHQENAMMIAAFLEGHAKISKVYYPGLKSSSLYELSTKQMLGYSGLMSFDIKTENVAELKNFINTLSLFKIGVSWGGFESLVFVPAIAYLKELPPERFKELGITLGSIRISVGLENKEDLIDDLESALKNM